MKEQDIKLTIREVEELCRLYMDCQLSVLEETELQYVLGKLPYSTPLINDVRTIMGIRLPATEDKQSSIKFRWFTRRSILSIAASLTLLFGLGFAILNKSTLQEADDTSIYISYVNGQKMGPEQSILQGKADMKLAEELINHITELEARELARIDELTDLIQLNK